MQSFLIENPYSISDLKWAKNIVKSGQKYGRILWKGERKRGGGGGSFVLPNRCTPPPAAMYTPTQKIVSQQSP